MHTEPITLHVSADIAQAFHEADLATLNHIRDLLEFALIGGGELSDADFDAATVELDQAMAAIGAKARERGLTDEKLKEILYGPKS
ncbi:MAG: hypothetical protein AAGI08_11230 [Bacteroidota bacterium]